MAQTYSLSVTAMDGNDTKFTPPTIQVGDTDIAGNVVGPLAGSQNYEMRTNSQILCKRPDGSQAWYTIDPVRSVAGGSLVLLAV